MRTLVLRVVAEPPQLFWAPLLPAVGNVFINISAMLLGIMGFDLNPLPFFAVMLFGHALLAGYASRDPHISSLISAWMVSRRKTVNLIPVQGNKYVP